MLESAILGMADFGRWCSFLLFVFASIGNGFSKGNNYLFHIPWACSVMYEDSVLIGAGAILTANKVLVSVNNFNEKVESSNPPKRYFEVLNEISVFAGSNFVEPNKIVNPNGNSSPLARYAQMRKADKFYVAFKIPRRLGGEWDIKVNPNDISPTAGADHDAYGLIFNVGVMVLTEPFQSSSYVMPMLIKGTDVEDLSRRTKAFKKKLETSSEATVCVTYSWNQRLNRIRYHEVTYLPENNCLEVFCNWNVLNCWLFPKKEFLLCFKATKYADVCPNARGAALYCPGFENSVLAILTTAPSCGQKHLPGVYTTIPWVIEFIQKALKENFDLGKSSTYNLFSLPQKNSDYEGVL